LEQRIGILTVSDTRNESTDESGPAAEAALREIGFRKFERRICRDDLDLIQAEILDLCEKCDAVFTTGGTGFAFRDVTPEATAPLLDRRADSLCELMRLRGLESTELSHLSRGVAGTRNGVLIVNLPGSPSGARHGVTAISRLIGPILDAAR
jgi:molybdenum cofactor synthesis domain-containing protein